MASQSFSAVMKPEDETPSQPLVCTAPSTMPTRDIESGNEFHWTSYGIPSDLRVVIVNIQTSELAVLKTQAETGLTLTPSSWQLGSQADLFTSAWTGDATNYPLPLDTNRILTWNTTQGEPRIIKRSSDTNIPQPYLFSADRLSVKTISTSVYASVHASDIAINGHASVSATLSELANQTDCNVLRLKRWRVVCWVGTRRHPGGASLRRLRKVCDPASRPLFRLDITLETGYERQTIAWLTTSCHAAKGGAQLLPVR